MYGIAGLLTGRTLAGRYHIDAVVGRGGMGAVYRATDERLGRAVAVKVIGAPAADSTDHDRLRARFHREARAAAGLHHPNVVSVYDFGTDEALALDFLVMELLVGEDLAARLARGGSFPLEAALSVLCQAARGLAVGHRAGMVHRDVKPGNLFLEAGDHPSDLHVRVLDFGIAQLPAESGTMTHLTEFGRSPYSPAYASPEQLRGEDGVTAASDVFSLAAVGYHLVTGTRAYTSTEPTRMALELSASLMALRERAPRLDDAAYGAILRALSRKPADRLPNAAAFAEALAPRQGASTPMAAAHPPRPLVPTPPRREMTPAAPDDATRLFADRDAHTQMYAPVAASARTPSPPVREPVRHEPLRQQYEGTTFQAPVPADTAAPARRAPRRGVVREFLQSLWEFTVTSAVAGMFVAVWALVISGVAGGDAERISMGVTASVLLAPLAMHRLTGCRGRFGVGLAASVGLALAVMYFFGTNVLSGRSGDSEAGLAALFGGQVIVTFLVARATRRREPDPLADL